ncbi:MAG: hypothetical protein WBN40_07330 [Pseudomonadales bacterium]
MEELSPLPPPQAVNDSTAAKSKIFPKSDITSTSDSCARQKIHPRHKCRTKIEHPILLRKAKQRKALLQKTAHIVRA